MKPITDLICQAEPRGNGGAITAPKAVLEGMGIKFSKEEKTKFSLKTSTNDDGKAVFTYTEV